MRVDRWLGMALGLGLLGLLGVCALGSTAEATERPERAASPSVSTPTKHRLYGTTWHSAVAPALAAATKSERKPVLVLRVLGAIDGKT